MGHEGTKTQKVDTRACRKIGLLLALGLWACSARGVRAQSHFSTCLDGAGNIFNATVIMPAESAPEVDGVSLAVGSEIAVFSSDPQYPDLCVGAFVWQAQPGFFAVWGDDDLTAARDGLLAGEVLRYRVWDRATGIEYADEAVQVRYEQGNGRYEDDAVMVVTAVTVTAAAEAADVPQEVQLYAPYPNPFREATTIAFGLPQESHVTVEVYDLLGKRIATLLTETMPAGRHEVRWPVPGRPSGLYWCRLQAGDTVLIRTLTVVK